MTDFDDGFITLDDAETLVMETGQWRGTVVEFSNDGISWSEAWPMPAGILGTKPDETITHPEFARATVKRKFPDGDKAKRTVTVRWAEYVPDEGDDFRASWDRMPTIMLGKVAVVSCYRGVFRDVIGNRFERAELDQAGGERPRRGARPAPIVLEETAAEWLALITEAKTPGEVREIDQAIRGVKQMTEEINVALTQRLAQLEKKPRSRS